MEVRSIDERDMHEIQSDPVFRVIDWWFSAGTLYRERSHAFELENTSLLEVIDWAKSKERSTSNISEIYCVVASSPVREAIFVLIETIHHGKELNGLSE